MPKTQSGDRKERLAAALRANLKRRKARDRALAQTAAPERGTSPPHRPKSGTKSG